MCWIHTPPKVAIPLPGTHALHSPWQVSSSLGSHWSGKASLPPGTPGPWVYPDIASHPVLQVSGISTTVHTLEGRDLAFSLLWSQDLTQCQVRNGLSITSVKGMKVLPLILIINFLGTGTPTGYVCVSFMGPRRIINYIQTVPDLQWFKWQFSTSWWQESSTHSVEMALWSLNFIFSWASDMQCSLVMLGSGNSRSSRSALGSWG